MGNTKGFKGPAFFMRISAILFAKCPNDFKSTPFLSFLLYEMKMIIIVTTLSGPVRIQWLHVHRALESVMVIAQLLCHVQLFCRPIDCSLPGSSVHGIFQARTLERATISFSRGSSRPRNQAHISCIGRQILYHHTSKEAPTPGIVSTK